jgi:hypothetical protein
VVAVDDQAGGGLADGGSAGPEVHVVQGRRVRRVRGGGAGRADLRQRRRVGGAGVEEDTGDLHTVDVGHRHGRDAVVRDEGGEPEPEPEDDGVRTGHPQRLVEMVDTGRDQQVGLGASTDSPRCTGAPGTPGSWPRRAGSPTASWERWVRTTRGGGTTAHPSSPHDVQDASADAITACGLLDLSAATGRREYHRTAVRILTALSQTCLTRTSARAEAVVARCTRNRPAEDGIEISLPYADHYLLEGILRPLGPAAPDRAIDLPSA